MSTLLNTAQVSHARANRDHRRLTALHWINLALVIALTAVGAYRTWGLNSAIMNRMDIVVVTAGAKSIAFLLYILVATHIFPNIYSTLTIVIMSVIDTVLWLAALALTIYGMIQIPPTGTRQTLTYVLIALLAIEFVLSLPVLYLAIRQRQHAKRSQRSDGVSVAEGPTDNKY